VRETRWSLSRIGRGNIVLFRAMEATTRFVVTHNETQKSIINASTDNFRKVRLLHQHNVLDEQHGATLMRQVIENTQLKARKAASALGRSHPNS
jgi:hypothetical protein